MATTTQITVRPFQNNITRGFELLIDEDVKNVPIAQVARKEDADLFAVAHELATEARCAMRQLQAILPGCSGATYGNVRAQIERLASVLAKAQAA